MSRPRASPVTSSGDSPAAAASGTKPSGTGERNRAGPATVSRAPSVLSTDALSRPPARRTGQLAARQGAAGAGELHGASGAIPAGRTITPLRRTGLSSVTSVPGARPSACNAPSARALAAGVTGPSQLMRTARSSGPVEASTARAA